MSIEAETVTALCPHSTGVWWVQTMGGTIHVWDFDACTVMRAPGGDSVAGQMRFDGDPRPLVGVVVYPQVGNGAMFLLQHPHDEERIVIRTCSTVTKITRPPR